MQSETDAQKTRHTVIMSDIHLSEGEIGQPGRSLWKRYKRPKYFIDQSFRRLLEYLDAHREGKTIELVLNGDIFDFDSVMRLPAQPSFKVSWLEKRRGLHAEEKKSRFKMETILNDHPVWVGAIREFVRAGHSVVFVIGNHDVELHWPAVQQALISSLALTPEQEARVRVCEWFYLSEKDTLIEHGNQYDDYCVTQNPIHPLIKFRKKSRVRLPFGNISSRLMVNGMGLFNPHVESSFLMKPLAYLKFFFKYAIRVQPLLPLTWLWSSVATFWFALSDGIRPSMKDPLYIAQRVEEIAEKAQVTPTQVRVMNDLQVHPAIFNPIKIARELWLDRVAILFLVIFVSFQIFAVVNIVIPIGWFWWALLFLLLFPGLIYYSKDIKSEIIESMDVAIQHVPLISRITGVKRVVFGHTHREVHFYHEGIEVLNPGTWSPAFSDPECRVSFGRKCFIWIRPKPEGVERTSALYEWKDPGILQIETTERTGKGKNKK